MADNKWWIATWMVGAGMVGGCVAPAGSDDPSAATTVDTDDLEPSTGPDDTTGADSTGVDNPVQSVELCGERAELEATADELDASAIADADVGLDLLGQLGESDDNVLLSPLSLRSAFGQVYAGTGGNSRTQIAATLGFDGLGDRTHAVLGGIERELQSRNAEGTEEEPAVAFRPANRTFVDVSYADALNDDWLAIVQQQYGTCVEVFDINADPGLSRTYMNDWVASQTNDLIPELIGGLPDVTAMVVVNALYFKASWATPFVEAYTEPDAFTTRGGVTKDVPTMHASVLPASHAQGEGWVAVGLPYSDGRLEMVVIVPDLDTSTAFEEGLDGVGLDAIFDALAPTYIDLSLPKFDLKSEWSLKDALEMLGMTAPFSNGGDFSGIAAGMYPIFEVFHDVAIAVDEKGTEAAAATAIVFGDEGGEEPVSEYSVVVDRTFYVAIHDRSIGSVMFFARIGDPG